MYRKNTAGQFLHFQGVDATTGGIKSGVTWTMRRCLDGTFAAGGGTVTEDGTSGWYKCALAQADTNGNNCAANFTGTGAVPQTINFLTDGSPPDINVKNLLGTAWLTPVTAGTPDVNVKLWNGLTTVALPLAPTVAGRTLAVDASNRALSDIDTIKTNPVVNAGTVTFPTTATLASTTNITAGTITTVGTLTTYTGNTPQTADVATLITTVGAAGAGLTGVALSLAGRQAIATTALVESYAALHVAPTWAQALFEIRSLLAEKAVASTTLTTKKIDGSTTAETFTLDSATAPTSITRAS